MSSMNLSNSPNLTNSYQPMLQESTQHFLTQLNSGVSDFSHFNLMFSRLIQTMVSPPIEVIWFYTAINYHTHRNMTKNENLGQLLCVEELFNSLVSCSSSCSSSSVHRIAVLAPLIYELHNLTLESNSLSGLCSDNADKKEISCLVDRLVSYISLCCCEGVNDHDDSRAFSDCFVDLVKVWTVGRRGESCEFKDDFRMFFPLVSDEGRNEIWLRGEVGVLAGFVMCEVFLLNLCLKFGAEETVWNSEEVVMKWAVDVISGFRSCYFFDALLKMLLKSNLPVTSLLNAADVFFLQEALFGAIVLVDYPFFNPACGICLCNHHLNSLASTWLFVADRAMQFVRNNDNQIKAFSYTKAFTKSHIHCQLKRWVFAQIGMDEDANKPNLSTPAAFLEWLVQLKLLDSRVFDKEFSLFLDKATHYKSKTTSNLSFFETDGNKDFYLNQKDGLLLSDGIPGDLEMIDSTDGIKSDFSASEACRKRKGEKDEDSIRVKLLKYHIEGRPINIFKPFQAEVGLARRS